MSTRVKSGARIKAQRCVQERTNKQKYRVIGHAVGQLLEPSESPLKR